MAYQTAPLSELETLRLADLFVTFQGSIDDPLAEYIVEEFARQITRVLEERNFAHTFPLSGEIVRLDHYTVDIACIEAGSIRATIYLIGSIAFGTYTGIAAYPSFKEALPVIQSDVQQLIGEAENYFKTSEPDSQIQFQEARVLIREEEDLESDFDELRRRRQD